MRKILLKILLSFLKLYSFYIAPFIWHRCRFYPTCSSYAVSTLKKRNFISGIILIIWRIIRCNPFCNGGYDPP